MDIGCPGMLHTRFLISSIHFDKYIKLYGWGWAGFVVEQLIRKLCPVLGFGLKNIHIVIARRFLPFTNRKLILDTDHKSLIEILGE